MDVSSLWENHFPTLWQGADDWLRDALLAAPLVSIPADQTVFYPDMPCKHYLLVVAGSVRVQLTPQAGREVVLYRVQTGQSCVLTTSCLLGEQVYPAEGITEQPTQAFTLPLSRFHQALDRSALFRQFVFADFGQRLGEVIQRMEQITQWPIEARLAQWLLQAGVEDGCVVQTHQHLAAEIGSVREVVSRHLKRFEALGWVRLGRGSIEILDRTALEKYSQ